MTNLFKPSMPDTSAQEAAMKRQEELLEKQEARVGEQESEERKKIAARMRARRSGGYRSLLAPSRSGIGLSGIEGSQEMGR